MSESREVRGGNPSRGAMQCRNGERRVNSVLGVALSLQGVQVAADNEGWQAKAKRKNIMIRPQQ